MKLRAHAKLNLYLEICDRRSDGYHNLRSIMQRIQLHDVLFFRPAPQDELFTRGKPMHETNLVVRAVNLLRQYKTFPGVRIELQKQIPIGSGLGGGSSDAATTMLGLNKLFKLGLSNKQLQQLGSTLGADIPFFMQPSAALVTGTGTEITPIPEIDLKYILLARPDGRISTAKVYASLQPEDYVDQPNFDEFMQNWKHGILGTSVNHLEAPAFRLAPEIQALKNGLLATSAQTCMMSGSGNVVFAVYAGAEELQRARKQISSVAQWTRASSTVKEEHE